MNEIKCKRCHGCEVASGIGTFFKVKICKKSGAEYAEECVCRCHKKEVSDE